MVLLQVLKENSCKFYYVCVLSYDIVSYAYDGYVEKALELSFLDEGEGVEGVWGRGGGRLVGLFLYYIKKLYESEVLLPIFFWNVPRQIKYS